MKIVSACLAGENCKWSGGNSLNSAVRRMVELGEAVPACPEVLGGLPVPRTAAEIRGGTGLDVLEGRAKVVDSEGNDVTRPFVSGAEEFLRLAKERGATEAILKSRSPSCGCGSTFDGTFSHTFIEGDGITAALLKRNGIRVVSAERD
jgi:uncharacterized protein YbbK (DUF523 family)